MPVDESFLEPALQLLGNYCQQRRDVPALDDEQFLRLGILRVFGQCDSGRDFLQAQADAGRELARTTWFDALHSPRWLAMVAEVAGKSYEIFRRTLQERDWLEAFPELTGRAVWAVDGNQIAHARHARPALPTTRPVSRSEVQNTGVQADIELIMRSLPPGTKLMDIRGNQTQTATDGGRAGTNRPDLQLTIIQAELPNGRRVHIEYDRSPPTRALDDAKRIIANDPDAIVILKIIDYEPPNRPRPPGRQR